MTITAKLLKTVREVVDTADVETLDYARVCLLDRLGVAVAGAHERVTQVLVEACKTLGSGHVLELTRDFARVIRGHVETMTKL